MAGEARFVLLLSQWRSFTINASSRKREEREIRPESDWSIHTRVTLPCPNKIALVGKMQFSFSWSNDWQWKIDFHWFTPTIQRHIITRHYLTVTGIANQLPHFVTTQTVIFNITFYIWFCSLSLSIIKCVICNISLLVCLRWTQLRFFYWRCFIKSYCSELHGLCFSGIWHQKPELFQGYTIPK